MTRSKNVLELLFFKEFSPKFMGLGHLTWNPINLGENILKKKQKKSLIIFSYLSNSKTLLLLVIFLLNAYFSYCHFFLGHPVACM